MAPVVGGAIGPSESEDSPAVSLARRVVELTALNLHYFAGRGQLLTIDSK